MAAKKTAKTVTKKKAAAPAKRATAKKGVGTREAPWELKTPPGTRAK